MTEKSVDNRNRPCFWKAGGAACTGLLIVFMVAWPVAPIMAASSENPDWPCIQRLVPKIAPGQVWAGPELDPADWRDDQEVRNLAEELAARRLPIEEAVARIGRFAEQQTEANRNVRLTALFGRTLEVINNDRGSLIAGIGRFARSQRERAEQIREDRVATNQQGAPSPGGALLDDLSWEIRIYQDRQRSLTYLCEQPVLLDQRAFALGRAIHGALLPEEE